MHYITVMKHPICALIAELKNLIDHSEFVTLEEDWIWDGQDEYSVMEPCKESEKMLKEKIHALHAMAQDVCKVAWKQLLAKYIAHVGRLEGTDFLRDSDYDEDIFTPEEWRLLQAVAEMKGGESV